MAGEQGDVGILDNVKTMDDLAKNAKNPMTYLKMGGLMTGGTAIFVALFASTKTGQDFFGTLPMFFSKGIDGKKWNWADAKNEYLAHKGDKVDEDAQKEKTPVEIAQEKAAIAEAEAKESVAKKAKQKVENSTIPAAAAAVVAQEKPIATANNVEGGNTVTTNSPPAATPATSVSAPAFARTTT